LALQILLYANYYWQKQLSLWVWVGFYWLKLYGECVPSFEIEFLGEPSNLRTPNAQINPDLLGKVIEANDQFSQRFAQIFPPSVH
jgi:hypothetical protein